MNEITAITPQVKDKTRCNIYIDGRFCCGLTLETVVKNRLMVGKIVTEQALAEWSPTAATLVLTPDDPRLVSYVK